jgi:ribonuclease Z
MEPPVIYLPEHALDLVDHLLKICQRLDRGRQACELIGVRPGDEFELSRELVLSAVATRHTIASVGYVVWERRKKLKAEYQGLTGEQIRDIRLSGVDVAEERRVPVLGVTGDTAPEGLDLNPVFYDAKVLITEMSFVAPSHRKDKIHKHGHMHLDDFVERRSRFNNELVIASHFSTRYHDKQIRHYVRRALPDMLGGRLHLWL